MSIWRYTTFHYFFAMDLYFQPSTTLKEIIEYLKRQHDVVNLHNSCVKEIYNGRKSWNNKNEECVSCVKKTNIQI
jgi:hypothetical protein